MSRLVALLVGAVLLLAGCTSDSAPGPTTGPLVVIGMSPTTSRTTTTTTTEPRIDPTQCSAVALDGVVENYPGAYDGLPDPVEATRRAIIEAALRCDFATLMTIDVPHVEQGTWSEDRPSIFEGVTTDFDEFVAYDQQHSALKKLVMALSSVPVERVESEFDGVPLNGYEWPPHFFLYDADTETMQSLDDVWDDDAIERVAALNELSANELVAAVDEEFAAYTSFRVVILDDGSWMLAGGSE